MSERALSEPAGAARDIARGALRCSGAGAAVGVASAATVRLTGLAGEARSLLGFGFGGIDRGLRGGIEIAVHNGRLAAAVLLAAVVVSRLDAPSLVPDVVLGGLLVFNAGFLGAALGAYGGRLAEAVALHLPLEACAFSLVGGAYLAGRSRRLPAHGLLAVAFLAATLLVAGGVVEASFSLGGIR